MRSRAESWSVVLVAGVVVTALLACKKKSEQSTPPANTQAATTAAPTAPPPAMPDKLYKVGETGKALDYNLAVENVTECKRKWSSPKKGNIFLGVEATVEATADKQFMASPSQAKVIDSQNLTYNSLGYASTVNCDPTFKFTNLAKGEKAKGWLIFEVPKDASSLKMSYNPISFGTPQTVKFDLGR
jgi:hypothetical protein